MKILSVDYGDARTGIAICDQGERLASPVTVITEYQRERLVEKIAALAAEQGAEAIVVGNPINMDGSFGGRSERCTELGQLLETATGLSVTMWDERRTTCTAIDILNQTNVRGKKRKAVIDAVAAVLILEHYLSYRKHHAL